MDKIIDIKVRNRIAVADPGQCIVCGNKDYAVAFDFDDEWSGANVKTARFFYKDVYIDRLFTGNTVDVPELANISLVKIGVFTEDITTTPAIVRCYRSILCDGGTVPPPEDDVYDRIIKLINELQMNGVTDEQIAEAVEKYLTENPIEGGGGEAGGYYIPTVDSSGNISWSASDSGMPTVASANIKGPKGDTGPQGPAGADGEKGEPGAKGDKGDTGAQGAQGEPGAKGDKGDKGDTGATGPQGPQGEQGPKGDTGATGPAGKDGSAGAAGADGISPTVSVSKSGKVTTITITDKNGTKTVDVMDGEKGDPGSDASVTKASIKTALGYTPADAAAVEQITDYIHITPGEDGEKAENIRDDASVAWTDGLYVNYQTGATSQHDSYTGSEHYFILPEGGRVFARFKNNNLYYPAVAFYNGSRAFLGGEYPILSSTNERDEYNGMYGYFYNVPEGAKYFRASFGIAAKVNLEIYLIYPTKVGGSVSIPDLDIPKSAIDGKTVVCFGDSLFGMYRGEDSAPAFIEKETGAKVYNVGFGGCRMSVHPTSGYAAFSMWALAKAIAENNWTTQDAQASGGSAYFPGQLALLKSIDFSKVDIAVIHYGTNDFGAGTAVAIDNTADPDDYNTLCGALRYSLDKLLAAYPKLRIYVSLPVYRYWTDGSTTTYAETYINKGGKTLPEFVEALRGVAAEYNLPVIDGYYGMGINKANASTYLEDGTHHNATGRERFGRYIGANLISQQTSGKSGMDTSAVQSMIDSAIGAAIGGAY